MARHSFLSDARAQRGSRSSVSCVRNAGGADEAQEAPSRSVLAGDSDKR